MLPLTKIVVLNIHFETVTRMWYVLFFIFIKKIIITLFFIFQSFVSCKIGFEWIGYTMLCFGTCDTIGSLLFGILGKYTGRVPLLIFGTLLNLGIICVMRFWTMSDDGWSALLFIIPAAWGLCDAIWITQSQGKY